MAIWTFPLGGVASAQPANPELPAAASTLWAYGGITSENVSWHGVHGVYLGSATYGFSAILTQVNTSATTFTLSENQTVGTLINLTYCRPNCQSPVLTEQYSYHAWESWTDATNFTTSATVTLRNGTVVPALGISGANASSAANITEQLTTMRNGSTAVVKQLFASASSTFALNFTGALGLFPLNLTAGTSWIGSAIFSATGSWSDAYLAVGPVGQLGPIANSGSLTGSGAATIRGSDRGSLVLSHRTLTQVATQLDIVPTLGSVAFMAGFDLVDGFAILPHVADLLESAPTASWATTAVGNTTAVTSLTDLGARSSGGPESFVASAWSYSTAISNPDPSTSGSSNTVQGAPITPAQASSTSECLEGATTCATTASNPTIGSIGGTPVLPIVFLSVGAIAIVGIVGALLIAQRRRIPPPSYPNAALYPPGRALPPAPTATEPDSPEPSPEEDDPLQNLW